MIDPERVLGFTWNTDLPLPFPHDVLSDREKGLYGTIRGGQSEERALFYLKRHKWVSSARSATMEEDSQGADLVVKMKPKFYEGQIPVVKLQIKSSYSSLRNTLGQLGERLGAPQEKAIFVAEDYLARKNSGILVAGLPYASIGDFMRSFEGILDRIIQAREKFRQAA